MENLPIVHVVNGRQKKLLQGHPWVYGNEIERVEGEIEDGGLVTVVDFRGRYMGTGFYNSKSLITVRLLTHRQEEITDELIASRVKAACDYRRFVMNRPGTDSCRLIYGEADRLPGVIADRFGGVIVLQVLALGMERFTQTIADALLACEKPDCLLLQNDDAIRRKEGMECFTRVLYGTLPEENIIHENGVKLAVDVLGGQKTGYFLDQKDNHLFVRQFCKDARVLDCFSYIGAFALNDGAVRNHNVSATVFNPYNQKLHAAAHKCGGVFCGGNANLAAGAEGRLAKHLNSVATLAHGGYAAINRNSRIAGFFKRGNTAAAHGAGKANLLRGNTSNPRFEAVAGLNAFIALGIKNVFAVNDAVNLYAHVHKNAVASNGNYSSGHFLAGLQAV